MAICTCVAAISLTVIGSSFATNRAPAENGASAPGQLQLADARPYLHCHNLPRRTYCHKGRQLPVNWPPNPAATRTGSDESKTMRPSPPRWFSALPNLTK